MRSAAVLSRLGVTLCSTAPRLQLQPPTQSLVGLSRFSSINRHRYCNIAASRALLPVVYHPEYSAPQLGEKHTFPMQVFRRIHDRLLQRRVVAAQQLEQPTHMPSRAQLLAVHDANYVEAFLTGTLSQVSVRRIGFGDITRTQTLIRRTLWECAGTLLTARLALACGLAVNTAGGTHHAHPSFGSGFCLINDLGVTAETLLREAGNGVERVMVVDLDVHQGDGTAAMFADRENVHVFDIHCGSNFPFRKQTPHTNIPLPDGTADAEYIAVLEERLAAALASFRPNIVLYDAGVDTHAEDRLGRLSLSDDGLRRRELTVLDACLAEGIPVAGYVGGGYDKCLDTLADRHIYLHEAATYLWSEYQLSHEPLQGCQSR